MRNDRVKIPDHFRFSGTIHSIDHSVAKSEKAVKGKTLFAMYASTGHEPCYYWFDAMEKCWCIVIPEKDIPKHIPTTKYGFTGTSLEAVTAEVDNFRSRKEI